MDWKSIKMTAYELYSIDIMNRVEFIGILLERRKDPKRITEESILNWGRMILGHRGENKKIFYKCVTINDLSREMTGV